MKQIIITSIAFILLGLGGLHAQTFVDTAKRWNTVIHRLPSYTIITENIKFDGDTTIGLVDYKKVFRSTDEFQTAWESYGYIRETIDEKVYYRTDSTPDCLLYDFDLALNEIVEVYGIQSYGNNYSLSPMSFFVSNIDSVEIGSELRGRYHLNPVLSNDTLPDASEFWIEGIGSISGILHWEAFLVGGDSYELLCFSENEEYFYQNSSYTSCYYFWTGIEENENNDQINIYPNPITDKASITIENYDSNKVYTLEIYDELGRKIFENKIYSSLTINRDELNLGLYVFKIICNGQTMKTEKIMIQ